MKEEMSEEELEEFRKWKKQKEAEEKRVMEEQEAWSRYIKESSARMQRESDRLQRQHPVVDLRKPACVVTEPKVAGDLTVKRIFHYEFAAPFGISASGKLKAEWVDIQTWLHEKKIIKDARRGNVVVKGRKLIPARRQFYKISTFDDNPVRDCYIKTDEYGEPKTLHVRNPNAGRNPLLPPEPREFIYNLKVSGDKIRVNPDAVEQTSQYTNEIMRLQTNIKNLNLEYGALKLEIARTNKSRKHAKASLSKVNNELARAKQQLKEILELEENRKFIKDRSLIDSIKELLN